MKRLFCLAFAASILIVACHRKAAPVIAERTNFPEPPKPSQPAIAGASPEFIAAGKTLYTGKCVKCHDLKGPEEYNAERWTGILKSMIPKARLNEEQAKQLTAYVMANAKK